MILGFDLSTSIVGVTIINNSKIILSEAWDLRNKNKYPDIFSKIDFIKEKMREIDSKYNLHREELADV